MVHSNTVQLSTDGSRFVDRFDFPSYCATMAFLSLANKTQISAKFLLLDKQAIFVSLLSGTLSYFFLPVVVLAFRIGLRVLKRSGNGNTGNGYVKKNSCSKSLHCIPSFHVHYFLFTIWQSKALYRIAAM